MKLSEPSKVEGCKCIPVEDFEQVATDADKMKKIMLDNKGIGLAAPQVGIFKRFFIMKDYRSEVGRVILIINPQIVKPSEKIGTFRESCLTYPGEEFIVKRPKQALVSWFTSEGVKIHRKLSGREIQVFFHETDHLDGITCKTKGDV